MTATAQMPEIYQIELTSACNMQCSFCIHGNTVRKNRVMDFRDYCLAASYLKRGQTVGLYMMGEPLLYPWLREAVMVADRCGAKVELATNGLLIPFGDELLELLEMLEMPVQYWIMDLTLWKENSAKMTTVYRNACRVAQTVARMAKAGEPTPTVAFQMVERVEDDPMPFPDAVVEAASIVPEKILLKRKFLDTWAGQLPWLAEHSSVKPPENFVACEEPFNRVVVTSDLDVVPCCRDGVPEYVYGNLRQDSLADIWHGPVAAAMREAHTIGRGLPEPCRSCRERHIRMDRHQETEHE